MKQFILFFSILSFIQIAYCQSLANLDSGYVRKHKICKITFSTKLESSYYKNPRKEKITEYYLNKLGQIESVHYYNGLNGELITFTKYTYNDNHQLVSISEDPDKEPTYRKEYIYKAQELYSTEEFSKGVLYLKCEYNNQKLIKQYHYLNNEVLTTQIYKYTNNLLDSTINISNYKVAKIQNRIKHLYDEKGKEISKIMTIGEVSTVEFYKKNTYNEHDSLIEQSHYSKDNELLLHVLYNRRNDTLIFEDYTNNNQTKITTNYNYKNGLVSEIKYSSSTPKKGSKSDIYEFNKDSLLSKIICYNSLNKHNYYYFFYNSKKQLIEQHINSSNDSIYNRSIVTLFTYDSNGDSLSKKTFTNDFLNNIKTNNTSDTSIYDFKTKEYYVIETRNKKTINTSFLNQYASSQIDSIQNKLKRDRKINSWYSYQFGGYYIYFPEIKKIIKNSAVNNKGVIELKIKMYSSIDDIMYPAMTVYRQIDYRDKNHYLVNDVDEKGTLLFQANLNDSIITIKRFYSRTILKHDKDYLYKFNGNYQDVLSEINSYNPSKQVIKKERFASHNSTISYDYSTPFVIIETDDYGENGVKSYTIKQYDYTNHLLKVMRCSYDYKIASKTDYFIHNNILHEKHDNESKYESTNIFEYEFYK